ncbi:MAG: hypothetical protein RSE22_02765 [Mucinivorans sp.]
MIKIKSVIVVALVAIVFAAAGCAGDPPSVLDGAAEETFTKWMQKYAPRAEKKSSGIYLDFIKRGNASFVVPKENKSWMRLTYTLYTLNDVVAETRDSTLSMLMGYWSATTRFVDDLLPYRSKAHNGNTTICEGLRDAFQYLRVGDSVNIYIPVSLAYSNEVTLSGNSGYLGEVLSYQNRPIRLTVRLDEIINDPLVWEEEIVQDYARSKWGQLIKDTVAPGLYMRLLVDDPKGDPITTDSTVRYFFAERFMDHQLLLTNVEKVSKAALYFNSETASQWSYTVSSMTPLELQNAKNDTTDKALYAKVFTKMKAGQTVEVLCTSRWTRLKNAGSQSAIPQVLPYEPRRFQIRTLKWNEPSASKGYDWKALM